MRILFIHQNLPGQFRHLLFHFGANPTVEVAALGEERRIRENIKKAIPGVKLFGYKFEEAKDWAGHHALRTTDKALRRGHVVAQSLKGIRASGFVPDVVYGHPGWGEMLYVRDIFPLAKIVNYCEFYFNAQGQDFGFDPEFPSAHADDALVRTENMTQAISLLAGDVGISPTKWQRSRYPLPLAQSIEVVHDGIDTQFIKPDPAATITLSGKNITLSTANEVITFVSRNLEPYRGFHTFMRALPETLRLRPKAHILIVGGNEVSYGRSLKGQTYRELMLKEVGDRLDMARVHFLGRIKYLDYLRVLQISSAHIYLTYPFVLSWSMVEAMAAGCLIIGSDTAPVTEVIRGGENGLLTGFFDVEALVEKIFNALSSPVTAMELRNVARKFAVRNFDYEMVCKEKLLSKLKQDFNR